MIDDIEKAIVARLSGAITEVKVEAFPDKPDGYRMTHPRGVVLVAFGRATYSAPKATDIVVQERRLEWDVTLLFRQLREHSGAYGHLDAARMALTGWRFPGATKMFPVREQFVSQHQGIWTYTLTLAHQVPAIEIDEDELGPLLKQVNTQDDYGETEAKADG